MGTRSLITARIGKSKQFRTIYCNWDGYIAGVGRELFYSYNTNEKIEELIAAGDRSSIHDPVSEGYNKKRGESLDEVKPRISNTLEEAMDIDVGQEYHYVWDVFDKYPNKWKVSQLSYEPSASGSISSFSSFTPLDETIIEEEERQDVA